MPYPILDKIRRLVLYGTPIDNTINYYDNHDLQFHVGDSNVDYVELGVPLTEQIDGPPPQPLHPQQTHIQQQPQQQPHPFRSEQDDMQSILFDEEPTNTSISIPPTPPIPEPLHGTFRSRSASNNGPPSPQHHY
jgi:hypothetical protein